MKKIFACAAVFSLMFAACGDDSSSSPANGGDDISSVTESSSSGPVESSSSVLDSLRNVSMKFKGCYESPYNKVAWGSSSSALANVTLFVSAFAPDDKTLSKHWPL